MLDETNVSSDNVLEAIPLQKGKTHKIDLKNLPKGKTPCKNHDWEEDPTETHEFMQGFLCKKCKFGRLVSRSRTDASQ